MGGKVLVFFWRVVSFSFSFLLNSSAAFAAAAAAAVAAAGSGAAAGFPGRTKRAVRTRHYIMRAGADR
eukprot:423976-Rhodomonas_salina.2